jgi:hypothetical protein
MMSYRYYQHLDQPTKQLKRKFLDEIYSVIDGVANGWGVSILPEHLIKKRSKNQNFAAEEEATFCGLCLLQGAGLLS